jgi:thiol-disulfide isomerase/thioredoxin
MNIGLLSPTEFHTMKYPQSLLQTANGRKENSCMNIVLIIVVVLVLFSIIQIPSCYQRVQQIPSMMTTATSTMKAYIQKVSAKQANTVADKYLPSVSTRAALLTTCTEDDPKCNDFKAVDQGFIESTTKKLKEYIDSHSNMALMVFAPWCPHCHSALPTFMTAANRMPSHVHPIVINAELVDRAILSSLGVTHFPFIKYGDNVLNKAVTEENIVKMVEEYISRQEATPGPSLPEPTGSEDASSGVAVSASFASLIGSSEENKNVLQDLFK